MLWSFPASIKVDDDRLADRKGGCHLKAARRLQSGGGGGGCPQSDNPALLTWSAG